MIPILALVPARISVYIYVMEIQTAGMDMARSMILEKVGFAILSKTLKGAQDEAMALMKLLGSTAPLEDDSGGNIDLQA